MSFLSAFWRGWLKFWRVVGGRVITAYVFLYLVPFWWWTWWQKLDDPLRLLALIGASMNGLAVTFNGFKMPVEGADEWSFFPKGGTWRHKAMDAYTDFKILCDLKKLSHFSVGDVFILTYMGIKILRSLV